MANNRTSDPLDRWYDPHHLIFVGDDSRYAEGPFYALHGRVIRGILRSGLVPRLGGPEGAPRTLMREIRGNSIVASAWDRLRATNATCCVPSL